MFWESIPHGYVLLLDYRIWIAVILYGAGHWRFIILQQRYLLNLEGVTNVGLFKKKLFLVESVTDLINSLLVTLIVYFITPILIGGDSLMGLASTGTLITILFKSLLFGTIALLVLGFIPVVGDNTGTRFFALGIISLVIILGNHEIRDEVYHFSGDINNIAIGPWQLVGYLALVVINIYLFAIPIGLLENRLKTDRILLIVGPSLQALAALITIAMMTAYLRLGIENF